MKNRDKKKIIIDVAQKLFAKYGLVKTTVDDIAKKAKIGKASIYHYFRGKEELFTEVLNKEYNFLKKKLKEEIDNQITPQNKLKIYISKKIEYLKKLSNIYTVLKDDFLVHYTFVKNFRKQTAADELNTVVNILKDGNERDFFDIKDVELTAYAIIIALQGLENLLLTENKPNTTETNLDKLFQILFNGIVKR